MGEQETKNPKGVSCLFSLATQALAMLWHACSGLIKQVNNDKSNFCYDVNVAPSARMMRKSFCRVKIQK